jgi:HEAT repeat protein
VTLAPTVETKPEVTVAPTAAVTAARVGKQSRKKRKQEKKKQTTAVAQKPAPAESAKADEAAKTVETAPVAAATVEEVEEVTAAAPRVEEASAAPALESAAPVIKEVAAPSVEEVETTAPAVEAEEVAHAIAAEEMTAAIAPVVEQPPAEAETETPAVAEAALDEAVAEAPAEAESGVEAPAVEAAVEAPAVEETAVEERAIEPLAAEESAVEDRAIEPVAAEESAAETSVEIAPVLASAGAVAAEEASAREIEPAARELSADEVEAETRRLLEGVPYERGLASVTDVVSRQIVASSLLSALAGRDETRRQRARTAFIEQGYFNETARDLRDADAPAERASAARSLGLVGDRLATSHLIAALEDPSPDVRRAAVEALASVRDPKAVMPLEALRERERRERIKLPRRLIEHTIEVCLEAARETPQPTLAEVSAASALAPAEEATAQAAETAAAEARAPEVEAATATVEPAEAQTVETSAPEASAMSEATAEDVATSFYAPRVEEESRAEVEESPALFTSDEAVAEESVSEAPAAAPVEEPPALAYGWKSETRIEPFVTQTEEEHVTTDAHAAAHASLEFETHRADERAADEAPAVEGFEPTHEAAAEEWIEVDVEEPEFAQGKGWDAPGLKEIAPVESSEAHVEPTPPVLDEAEPTPAARAVTEMEVSQTPPAYASETYTAPAASAVDKGITPFVADEMSAVPKAIQLRLASDEPEERANAITDLARVDSDDAFRTICVGFDDPSADVRNAAARSLYSLQEDRAEAFTRALREASPHRRKNIGAAIAASGLAGEALSRLTGESREKTYDAFSLLFLMAKAGEVQPLIRAVEAHPDNEVRLAVVKLLALSGQRDILPAFRRLAVRGSLPAEVRSAVMEAIYQISSSQSTTTPAL